MYSRCLFANYPGVLAAANDSVIITDSDTGSKIINIPLFDHNHFVQHRAARLHLCRDNSSSLVKTLTSLFFGFQCVCVWGGGIASVRDASVPMVDRLKEQKKQKDEKF